MDNNQSLNNTENISLAAIEISLSRKARFWILLLFDIPSVACAFFVLFCILINRKLRSNIKNHVLVILLLLGIGSQLIDIPFYLNFIVQSSVVPSNPSTCLLWWFVDTGMYDGGVIFMAWTAFERHIILFHDQWISTRKRRIMIHYFLMLFLILYIFIYYIYAIYYFPCENTYDYTLPLCGGSPCYAYDPIMGMWDWIVNILSPTFLEALLSLTFIFRVLWQKHHSLLPIHWRKHRKMAIQLMSLSSLNMAFNIPLSIINIAYFCGLSYDIGAEAIQHFTFLCYFVIFLFPFICLASISGVKKKFYRRILRRRRVVIQRFTVTVKPANFTLQTTIQR
ncbi:unnamed protein product [Rotaria magnacalcarata]|uniref:G-protein coupled receptors family 1 profile domain-containing protein n=1 Tax=Rotaria magnacalcarata TaxID=392030 RepID=A0A815D4U7_9BILA|nr:unnamed protein product [Rotaria magnacalcarata]CAF2155942.1 unnamed protein product [Rotaria magnacalcarata]CAF3815065.1 unnamed protein product [Rotaria magnacalcarata]CAF3873535.1 unnamed protein product [Rotaria magnacalcarata]